MPDFSTLYKKSAGTAKRPPTMLTGDYPGIIKQFEKGESRQKRTPLFRYYITLLDFPAGAPTTWSEVDEDGKKWDYERSDIDLAKRPQRFEFYFPVDETTGEISDSAIFRFDEFLRSMDIEPDGQSYEVLESAPVGQRVLVSMVQQLNQENNRTYVSVNKIVGMK